ncbi:hypothetical protein B484DRAFT_435461 [Ochromonadaceae sp. CCMP2298]|nr:hypothetical protein B484DRAFT_435461 [Ochromonadaceae sp. CCMP2298]
MSRAMIKAKRAARVPTVRGGRQTKDFAPLPTLTDLDQDVNHLVRLLASSSQGPPEDEVQDDSAILVPEDEALGDLSMQLASSSIGSPRRGTRLDPLIFVSAFSTSAPSSPPGKRQKRGEFTADPTLTDPVDLVAVCGPFYAASYRLIWRAQGHEEASTTFLLPKDELPHVSTREDHVLSMRGRTAQSGYSELYALYIAFEKRFVIHMAQSSATVTVLKAYPPHLGLLAVLLEELSLAYVNGVYYNPIVSMLLKEVVDATANIPTPPLLNDAAQRRDHYRAMRKNLLVEKSLRQVKTTRKWLTTQTEEERQIQLDAQSQSKLTEQDRRNTLHSNTQRENEFKVSWTTSFDTLAWLCPAEAVQSGDWIVHFCTTCQAEDAVS